MFGFVRNKTSIIILILLLVSCVSAWANYIPQSASSTNNAAGTFLVMRTSDAHGELNADGNSHLHYIRTYVGDTSLHYDPSSGSSDQTTYNSSMISAIFTCFDNSEIELSLTMVTAVGSSGNKGYISTNHPTYFMPYILVVVRVSNFGANHNSYSDNKNDWLPESNSDCTYKVVAILDSRSPSTQTASNLYLGPGECFHVVMVPFSLANTAYLEGVNIYPGTDEYYARFSADFTYRIRTSSGNYNSGSASDAMNAIASITEQVSEYTALSFGFEPATSDMTVAELTQNSTSMERMSSTMTMSYERLTTATSFGTVSHLSVKLYPYGTDEYYFLYSGTSTPARNRSFPAYLKIADIQSSRSGVTLRYGNSSTKDISPGEIIDSKTYGSALEFIVETEERNYQSGKYKAELDADLSFDMYPYIESTNSALAGDYSMLIVAEFSLL